LGQRFTLSGLAAVTGQEATTLEPLLETLLRREMLNIETDPRSPERNQYGFVQSLIREVAYNTLARRDRKTRHLAAARYYESLETDELAGALAGQYAAAHANAEGPEETAALAAQARVALKAAAERAVALGAPDQAFEFFHQALGLAQNPADEAELALRAGQAAQAGGRYAEGEPLLRQAIELFAAADDRDGLDRAYAALATILVDAARFSEAIDLLEPILGEAVDFSNQPGLVAAGAQLARAHMLRFKFDDAIRAADRVLPAAELADMGVVVADLLVTKGTALGMARRSREALALIRAGQELGESLGANLVVLRAYMNQAFATEWISPRSTFESSRSGHALARRVGHRGFVMNSAFNAGQVGMHLGEWAWASSVLEDLLEDDLEAADRVLGAAIVSFYRAIRGQPRDDLVAMVRAMESDEPAVVQVKDLVDAYDALAAGRDHDAKRLFSKDSWAEGGFDNFAWSMHLAAWTRDDRALGEIQGALREAGRHGPGMDALSLAVEAARAALAGSNQEALALYGRAMDGWRGLELRFEEALLGIDMASVLDPSELEVQRAVQNSRVILSELGAIPFLERLSAVVGRSGEGEAPAIPVPADAVPISESEVAAS
jgi:tetratricopeptide (TPR) repeat protein